MTSKTFSTDGYVAEFLLSAIGTWAENIELLATNFNEKIINHNVGEWFKHQNHGFDDLLF